MVRRATQSLLGAMLPHAAPRDVYERLQSLPFVESGRDGLIVHDAVQEAVSAALKSAAPERHREYRRAAWRQLRSEVRTAGRSDLWRYTADMLYIIENPLVREGFFPSGAQGLAVEPAKPSDSSAIHSIAERHEGPEAASYLKMWWENLPDSFRVIRDYDNRVGGFYSLFNPE